eukprot:360622-Chlamydomonas_euryale.AAC.6
MTITPECSTAHGLSMLRMFHRGTLKQYHVQPDLPETTCDIELGGGVFWVQQAVMMVAVTAAVLVTECCLGMQSTPQMSQPACCSAPLSSGQFDITCDLH